MEDSQIIELLFNRTEKALELVGEKYGAYLRKIAFNILNNHQDTEECVNDVFVKTWNSIPPNNPDCLSAYLAKIARNQALNQLKAKNTQKRAVNFEEINEETEELFSTDDFSESLVERHALTKSLNVFLSKLKTEQRVIFMRRYWYFDSVKEICQRLNISESKVKSVLSRLRKQLKKHLIKEGVNL